MRRDMGEGMVEVESEKVREKIKDARKKDQRGETVAGDGDRGGEQQELIESYSLLSIQLHDSTCSLIFFNTLLCEYYFFSTQRRSCYDYCRTVRLTENLEPRHYVSGSATNGSVMVILRNLHLNVITIQHMFQVFQPRCKPLLIHST